MGFVLDNTAAIVPDGVKPADRVNPIVRVLPSLTDVTVILTLVFLFTCMGGTKSLLGDGDTGWHIRTGQWILTHGRVPHSDIFSYTMPGQPWYAWEWLWDVAFAAIYNRVGLGGVVVASIAILCAICVMMFRLVRRKCGNVLIAFVISSTAMAGSSLHWLARPHLFTLLFGILYYSMLERVKDALDAGGFARGRRLLYLLPALMVLWTNLHGGFALGIILLGCYGAGELVRWVVDPAGEKPAALRRAIHYLATAVACLLASLINPYFIELHRHIISYLHDSFIYEHIMEFQTISFHSLMSWFVEGMIVLGAISVFREVLRKQFVYAFLFLFWAHLALVAGRNIPIFMLVVSPIVAVTVTELIASAAQAPLAGWIRRAAEGVHIMALDVDETDRIPRLHLVSVAALALVAAIVFSPAPPEKFRPEYDTKRYPAKALAFLGGAGIPNRIFTDDEWGDYCIYTLYPTKVYIDGRSDFYGDKFGEEYIDLMNVKYDWQKTLARYRVDTVLLNTRTALAGALKESHDWRVVYDDGLAIIFQPVGSPTRLGERNSTIQPDGGTGRDRKITKSEVRDPSITKTTT
jgi:hypothetical protein